MFEHSRRRHEDDETDVGNALVSDASEEEASTPNILTPCGEKQPDSGRKGLSSKGSQLLSVFSASHKYRQHSCVRKNSKSHGGATLAYLKTEASSSKSLGAQGLVSCGSVPILDPKVGPDSVLSLGMPLTSSEALREAPSYTTTKSEVTSTATRAALPSEPMNIIHPVVWFLSSIQLQGYAGEFLHRHQIRSMQGLVERVRCEKDAKVILGEHASRHHQLIFWKGFQKWLRGARNDAKWQGKHRKTKRISNNRPLGRNNGESSGPSSVKVPRTEKVCPVRQDSPVSRAVETHGSSSLELTLSQLCDTLLWGGRPDPNGASELEKGLNGGSLRGVREGRGSDTPFGSPNVRRVGPSVTLAKGSPLMERIIPRGKWQEGLSNFNSEYHGSGRADLHGTLPDSQRMLSPNTISVEAIDADAEELEENEASKIRTQVKDDDMEVAQASKALCGTELWGAAGPWPHSTHPNPSYSDPVLHPVAMISHFGAFHKSVGSGRIQGVKSDIDTVQPEQEDGAVENSDGVDSDWSSIVQSLKDDKLSLTNVAPYRDLVELYQINSRWGNTEGGRGSVFVQNLLASEQGAILLDTERNIALSDLVNCSPFSSTWKDESDFYLTQEADQTADCGSFRSSDRIVSWDNIASHSYRGVENVTPVVLDIQHSMSPRNLSPSIRGSSQKEEKCDINKTDSQPPTSQTDIKYANFMTSPDIPKIPCVGRAGLLQDVEEVIKAEVPSTIQPLPYIIGKNTLEDLEIGAYLSDSKQPQAALILGDRMGCLGNSEIRHDNTIQHKRSKSSSTSLADRGFGYTSPRHGVGEECVFDDFIPFVSQVHNLGERWDGCARGEKDDSIELETGMNIFLPGGSLSTSPKPSTAVIQEILNEPDVSHFTSHDMEYVSRQTGNHCINGLPVLSPDCTAASMDDFANTASFGLNRSVELVPLSKEEAAKSAEILFQSSKTRNTACTGAKVDGSLRENEVCNRESPGMTFKEGSLDAVTNIVEDDCWGQFGLQAIQTAMDETHSGLPENPSTEGLYRLAEISPSATPPCGNPTSTNCPYRVECPREGSTRDCVYITIISDSEPREEGAGTPDRPDDLVKSPSRVNEANRRGSLSTPPQCLNTSPTAPWAGNPAFSNSLCGRSGQPDGAASTTLALQELVAAYLDDPSLAQLTLADLRMWCARLGLLDHVEQHWLIPFSTLGSPCPTPLEKEDCNANRLIDNTSPLPKKNGLEVPTSTSWEMIEADELRARLRLLAVRGYFYHEVVPECLHRVERISGLPYKLLRTSDLIAQQERYLLTHEDLECARQQAKEVLQEENERCIVASLSGHAISCLEQRVVQYSNSKSTELDLCDRGLSTPFPSFFKSDLCAAEDSDNLSLYERALILEPIDAEAMTAVVRKDFPFISHTRVQQMLNECDVPLQAVRQPSHAQSVSSDLNTPTCSPGFYIHGQPRSQVMHNEDAIKGIDGDRKDSSPLLTAPPVENSSVLFASPQPIVNRIPTHELNSLFSASPTPLQVSKGQKRRENTRRFFSSRGIWRGRGGMHIRR
ncbi:unnamed protein product [Phytomonas sp. Hart1]|nr:unnamed protein product [Phytomonas sp. Hart1]|eukprot:CCW71544.1 unnamed protein product [Phytomonas sp. isolate Hart1]